MKIIYLFSFLLLTLPRINALGIGVVPDKLVFDDTEETFKIINPNEITVDFEVISEMIDCKPDFGIINPKSEQEITCNAEKLEGDGIILVETYADEGDGLGVLPAIAIKAENAQQKDNITTDTLKKAEPLEINRQILDFKNEINKKTAIEEENISYTPEITSIALMVIGIISLMVYSHIKKRNKTNSALSSPSQQDAQDAPPSP
jgi:hypothetical protein